MDSAHDRAPVARKSLNAPTTFCAWKVNPDVGSSRKIALGSRTISADVTPLTLAPRQSARDPLLGQRGHRGVLQPELGNETVDACCLLRVQNRRRKAETRVQRKCLARRGTEEELFLRTSPRAGESSLVTPVYLHITAQHPPAGTRPERTFRRLVLPLPVGPMSAMTWFGTTAPVKPLRTSFAALSLPFGKTVYRNSAT